RVKEVRRRRYATLRRLRRHSVQRPGRDHPTRLSIALADGLDMEFVLVPAGEFLMGSPGAEENPAESPQHLVRIPRPFFIGRFPVTQAEWTALMGENPSRHRGDPRLP